MALENEHAKLEAYDKLENRFALWGKDVNKSLDDFEAFQKLNVDYVLNNLDRSIKQLSTLKNFLELRR